MKKLLLFVIILTLLTLNIAFSFASSEQHQIINEETYEKINDFKDEMNKISNIIMAFSLVTSVLIFVIHFIRLAFHAGGKPMMRSLVIRDIMISGVCTGLIGAIGLIMKIYVNLFS